jgi:CRP/FNR family transcriptional regulator, cyclic AMP receptor protein
MGGFRLSARSALLYCSPASGIMALVRGAGVSMVKGLSEDLAKLVASASRRHRYAAGTTIFREDEYGSTLHFVLSGRVAIEVTTPLGQTLTFTILGDGAVFGELALLTPGGVRTATAKAIVATETLAINASGFERLCQQVPEFNAVLVRSLAEQVQRLSSQLLEFLYLSVDTRIRRRLAGLCDLFEGPEPPIVVPLTQQQLGDLAGAARATVSAVLSKDREDGILAQERSRIVILDTGRLRRKAGLPP